MNLRLEIAIHFFFFFLIIRTCLVQNELYIGMFFIVLIFLMPRSYSHQAGYYYIRGLQSFFDSHFMDAKYVYGVNHYVVLQFFSFYFSYVVIF